MSKSTLQGIKNSLGPGLIMAAAAIGVSHLVQSTRAGAEYGFALVWAVILANIFKYPFLEFGPRYALATGKNMIRGYAKMSPVALWIFIIFTISTMFAVHAAVTIVTASLATSLTGIELSVTTWCGLILVLCVLYLVRNTYTLLDKAIKVLMVILAISTIVAMFLAFTNIGFTPQPEAIAPEIWTVSGVAFLIALMGWMPIPIDAAAWQSIWTIERMNETQYKPQLGEVQFDFNLGYIGTSIIALCFLTLGAMVMYGSGQEYAASAAGFSKQLIELYTAAMGDWAFILIAACAFITMFSTTLTVTDTYPRVVNEFVSILKSDDENVEEKRYAYLLVGVSAGSLLLLILLGDRFRFLIDLATTMSFLTAPVLAFMNHKLIHQPEVDEQYRPKSWLYWLSVSGIIFLTLFALIYLYWMLFY
ncbi:Nramp family divalent metal transporter [Rhodohalobacter sulfatireducens]|uniref:Nramp family divalent metal transporter n=1 Tax=Rhodohalobacter sulfatireducens TaxID=2911366 RepID=A0ABS9K8B7_9BACT|nr:Nramp family divalent metal transporter [Rhodohalobacter sulfatireducens]MCG2587100.1 Nramp family divalent metal transporter [Rhodohalobacter sulfatireducens]